MPFKDENRKITYDKIKAGVFKFSESKPLTEEAKDLISKILVVDPEKRLTLT